MPIGLVFFVNIDLPVDITGFRIQAYQFSNSADDVDPVLFNGWRAPGIWKRTLPCFTVCNLPFSISFEIKASQIIHAVDLTRSIYVGSIGNNGRPAITDTFMFQQKFRSGFWPFFQQSAFREFAIPVRSPELVNLCTCGGKN